MRGGPVLPGAGGRPWTLEPDYSRFLTVSGTEFRADLAGAQDGSRPGTELTRLVRLKPLQHHVALPIPEWLLVLVRDPAPPSMDGRLAALGVRGTTKFLQSAPKISPDPHRHLLAPLLLQVP